MPLRRRAEAVAAILAANHFGKVNAMAKVNGPLLSIGGGGQIGQSQVYSTWKGRPYVRRYVVPANPQSTEQTKTRNSFAWLNNVWRLAPAEFQAPWTRFASGKVLTNRNAFLSKNTGVLRSLTTLTGIVLSPGAAGGLAITPTITPGAGQLTFAATAPSVLPSGWSIIKLVGVAIRDQDPQTGVLYQVEEVEDATDPYSVVMSGLTAADWWAGAWFVYQRSAIATDLAYGPAIGAKFTVT